MRVLFPLVLLIWSVATAVVAQPLTALARVDLARTGVDASRSRVTVTLGLSQAVPFRVYALDSPRQIIVELSEVDWRGFDPATLQTNPAPRVMVGNLAPGWSGMIMNLDRPLIVENAEMKTEPGQEALILTLRASSETAFAERAGQPATAAAIQRRPANAPVRSGPPVIVVDPGHGGVDPGAERAGVKEADLMLVMARELRDSLRRAGAEVHLTRDADEFVSLAARASLARQVRADAFVSLHADALAEGYAEGASAHTLSADAQGIASALLAERVDRADILSGVDLSGQDDQIATILLDMARRNNAPRSEKLAAAVVAGLGDSGARLHRRSRQQAHFAVLRSADVPSVLVEVGFLSSKKDRIELQSPEKRGRIIQGLVTGLMNWAETDRAERALIRQ